MVALNQPKLSTIIGPCGNPMRDNQSNFCKEESGQYKRFLGNCSEDLSRLKLLSNRVLFISGHGFDEGLDFIVGKFPQIRE